MNQTKEVRRADAPLHPSIYLCAYVLSRVSRPLKGWIVFPIMPFTSLRQRPQFCNALGRMPTNLERAVEKCDALAQPSAQTGGHVCTGPG